MSDKPWLAFYEKGVPASIDYRKETLPQILAATAARFPDNVATVFEGGKLTYRQLQDAVERLATALAAMGVKPGDRVGVQLPNLPSCVIAYYGVLRAGAIAVMTNPTYVEREVEHQFKDAGLKVAIVLDAFWMKTTRAVREKVGLEHVVLTAVKDYLPFPKSVLFPLVGKKTGLVVQVPPEPGVVWLKDLLKSTPPAPPPMPSDWEAIANLQYTGGTTGVSKGAILTHRNLSTNAQLIKSWFQQMKEGEGVMLSALPFFHSFGLTVCMNAAIFVGATQALVPNPRDIKKVVGAIAKYRPTIFPSVPTLFNAINHFPGIEKYDIKSIKGCLSGSAPLPIEVLERFEQLTGGRITEGFGLSESSPVTHANPLFGLRKVGSIGIPVPDTDARIVDLETGTRECAVDEEGELILSGPQVMRGYWHRPDETAVALRDGWLFTGDIAKMDKDGYFYIVGRKKEMIIVGGFNVYPREVDEVLFEHPKVLDAAAVGVPDLHKGELVKAFVVPKPGETLTEDEVIAFCKEKLAPYKVPRTVEFRAELPKSNIGKVLRRVLREEEVAKQPPA